mgnify:CR=1 FL=1
MKKKRADELLYEHGHCESRQDAALLIMAGKVRSGKDALVTKPSQEFPADTVLTVDSGNEFVSRGARKLKEITYDRTDSDIIAYSFYSCFKTAYSTDDKVDFNSGGRCFIKRSYYAGVICLEGVNARTLSPAEIPEPVDILSMDVSFISATKILCAADSVMKPGATAFILVKPQFEAPKHDVPPGGVVTDPAVRQGALGKGCTFVKENLQWTLRDVSDSPLKGPKGNLEYVAVFIKNG